MVAQFWVMVLSSAVDKLAAEAEKTRKVIMAANGRVSREKRIRLNFSLDI